MWKDIKLSYLNIVKDNLQVRLANKDDAKRISDYFLRNRRHLKRWEPAREGTFFTEAGWRKKLIKLNELHLHQLGFYCLILDRTTDEMLGTVSFSNLVRFPLHSCSVGYSLDENAQGRGIMREALGIACRWMFTEQNMHRISASYMPANVKSAAVLRANGFKQVGFAKEYLLINGQWQDHYLTALINPDWQEKEI